MWPLVVGAGILAYLLFGKGKDVEMTPDAANEAMNKASEAASGGNAPQPTIQTSAGPQPAPAPAANPHAYNAPNLSAVNAVKNALNLMQVGPNGIGANNGGPLDTKNLTWDNLARGALLNYQTARNLSQTGTPNPATLEALANDIAKRGLNWQ